MKDKKYKKLINWVIDNDNAASNYRNWQLCVFVALFTRGVRSLPNKGDGAFFFLSSDELRGCTRTPQTPPQRWLEEVR